MKKIDYEKYRMSRRWGYIKGNVYSDPISGESKVIPADDFEVLEAITKAEAEFMEKVNEIVKQHKVLVGTFTTTYCSPEVRFTDENGKLDQHSIDEWNLAYEPYLKKGGSQPWDNDEENAYNDTTTGFDMGRV